MRLGAIPTMAAALLFLGFGLLLPLLLPTNEPLVEWVRDPDRLAPNVLALLMALLLPVGRSDLKPCGECG